MIRALSIASRAVKFWWREFILLTFFNIAWFALQIPLITGPPATAAMYRIVQRVIDGDLIEIRHGWEALQQMFWPALKWGVVNLVVVGVVISNFWIYHGMSGLGWTILRVAWGTIALGWVVVNLFYWPFWLSQEDRSLRLALRNGFLFLSKQPSLALTLTAISVVLVIVSILTTLPLVSILITWVALMGWLAVHEEIK